MVVKCDADCEIGIYGAFLENAAVEILEINLGMYLLFFDGRLIRRKKASTVVILKIDQRQSLKEVLAKKRRYIIMIKS
ncbi:MAG: hypothetical protein HUJ74_03715 [Lachnospiraceae bacterium]|nr:hypothetical protein [Lachnospiraceae bacterium]